MSKEEVLRGWGLKSNPFEVRPLESNERDMNLFVGREQEVNRIFNILQDMGHGICRRVGVLGQVGVGKSSFLNRIVYELHERSKPRCLPLKIEGSSYSALEFLLILMEKTSTRLLDCSKLTKEERERHKSQG